MDEPERRRWLDHGREHGYLRARLRLLTTAQGGRRTPIVTGYRACWGFAPEMHPHQHDAPLLIEDGTTLGLGEEAIVRLHPLWPEGWPEVRQGVRLRMLEGARLVGVAEVVQVVPPE